MTLFCVVYICPAPVLGKEKHSDCLLSILPIYHSGLCPFQLKGNCWSSSYSSHLPSVKVPLFLPAQGQVVIVPWLWHLHRVMTPSLPWTTRPGGGMAPPARWQSPVYVRPSPHVRVMLIFEDVIFPLWNHLFLCYPCHADFKTALVFKIWPILVVDVNF